MVEIAAYIPTNLISITDGQIYLDQSLFVSGFRPAIDIGLSVSRIGGNAQHRRIKEEAGRMKLDYLQFLELEVFTRFGARLEKTMESTIKRGKVLREILKQDRLMPLPVTVQLAWLIAFNDGCFDGVDSDALDNKFDNLVQRTLHSGLTLDSPRDEWSKLIADCFDQAGESNQT
jgi:F-type H+-transporting ATPase subunit alpha